MGVTLVTCNVGSWGMGGFVWTCWFGILTGPLHLHHQFCKILWYVKMFVIFCRTHFWQKCLLVLDIHAATDRIKRWDIDRWDNEIWIDEIFPSSALWDCKIYLGLFSLYKLSKFKIETKFLAFKTQSIKIKLIEILEVAHVNEIDIKLLMCLSTSSL